MGYRNYIGEIDKTEYESIKDLDRQELFKLKGEEDDGYVAVYHLGKELYNFGKYSDFEGQEMFRPFFTNKQLQDEFNEEHELFIVDKEYLKHIIMCYIEKIRKNYEDLLSGIEYTKEFVFPKEMSKKMLAHITTFQSEWFNGFNLLPFNLDKGDEVSTSWKYEYSIFELVRLYKTIDWDNKVIYWYGY